MAKGRTFCREKNQITDSIPFSRHSLPTQELNTALSWDSKVKQFCVFLSWTLFPQMTCKVSIESNNSFGKTSSVMKPLRGLLHLGFTSPLISGTGHYLFSMWVCWGGNLYSSYDPPYWHSISLVLPFLSFRDDQSLPFSKSCTPPLPFSKFCNPLSVFKIL